LVSGLANFLNTWKMPGDITSSEAGCYRWLESNSRSALSAH